MQSSWFFGGYFLCFLVLALFWREGQQAYLAHWGVFFLILLTSFGFPLLLRFRLPPFWVVFVGGLLVRVLLIHSPAFFEDDFFRYLIEGKMMDLGNDPFEVSPLDFAASILDGASLESVAERNLFYDYALHTGYSWLSAIYPPLVILWFSFFGSVTALGYGILALELAVLYVCWKLLKDRGPQLLTLWFLHPLVLWEGYLNLHYDLLIGLMILLGLCLLEQNQRKLAALPLAISIHLKGYALIFLPFLPLGLAGLAGAFWAGMEGISYALYPQRFGEYNSLGVFLAQWEFNNGLFTGLRLLVAKFWPGNEAMVVLRVCFSLMLGASVLAVYFLRTRLKVSPFLCVSVIFFLFSPINNPWYFLMALPFFLFYAQTLREFFFFSLCSLYYLLFLSHSPYYAVIYTTPLSLGILLWIFSSPAQEKASAGGLYWKNT